MRVPQIDEFVPLEIGVFMDNFRAAYRTAVISAGVDENALIAAEEDYMERSRYDMPREPTRSRDDRWTVADLYANNWRIDIFRELRAKGLLVGADYDNVARHSISPIYDLIDDPDLGKNENLYDNLQMTSDVLQRTNYRPQTHQRRTLRHRLMKAKSTEDVIVALKCTDHSTIDVADLVFDRTPLYRLLHDRSLRSLRSLAQSLRFTPFLRPHSA